MVSLLVSLLVLCIVFYLATLLINMLPIDPAIRQIIYVVVALILILSLLGYTGYMPGVHYSNTPILR